MLNTPARVARRLRSLLFRRRLEREMDDEMRLHLELEAADLMRSGMTRPDALRHASVVFGGVERYKDEARDARGVSWADDFTHDARYGLRQLARGPGFTVAALVTLALGIGATTTMYSMTQAVILRPLPFANSDALVRIEQCDRCMAMALGNYVTVRDQARSLDAVAAISGWSPILRGADQSEVLNGARVTVELFRMTGVPALVGRTFAAGDTAAGQPHVAMLGEAAWRARFGGDPGIVGTTLTLDGRPTTIIGVVPARLAFPEHAEVWSLIPIDAAASTDRSRVGYDVIGRMRPGSSLTDVTTELRAIGARVALEFPVAMRRQRFNAQPSQAWNEEIRLHFFVFLSAVAFVLIIACTNLAGLLLARLTSRGREIAVRAAMGAGRGRIARQLLTETLVLSLLGGLLGVAAAWLMLKGMRAALPDDVITGWSRVGMNWGALSVALAMGAVTGAFIGLGPAIRFSRPDLLESLKQGARSSGGSGTRLRRALVVAEVAFSIVLLAAAGLLVRTSVNLYQANPGIRLDDVLTMRLRLPPASDTTRRRPSDYYDRLTTDIGDTPGVLRAATVSSIPFGGFSISAFDVEGRPPADSSERRSAIIQAVTAGYFDVMRVPLVRGRRFAAGDDHNARRVAIINESAAQAVFTKYNEDPIGRALMLEGERYEVVGVVRDVFQQGANRPVWNEIYYPQPQRPRANVDLVVQTSGDPAALADAVRRVVASFDRDLAISRVATVPDLAAEFMQQYRIMAGIMVGFAVIALLISAIGLYGVVSFAVAQRTREFGIRLALGASPRSLLRLVLADGTRLAAIGIVIGLAGALGLTRAMRFLLYGVGVADPLVLASITVALGALALGASVVPARRATRVDPIASLRAD